MSELSFSLLLDWIGNTLISDSRAQQFSWKFIATLPSENCIFLIKMTLDFLVWCYCRFTILLVLSFVLQLVPNDVPAQLWQWHVMAFSLHASMQPCCVEFAWCCYRFMILMSVLLSCIASLLGDDRNSVGWL